MYGDPSARAALRFPLLLYPIHLLTGVLPLSTIEHTFDSRGGLAPVPAWLSPAPRLHDIDEGWDPVGPPEVWLP